MQASQPGNNYVTGADLFSLYDWAAATAQARSMGAIRRQSPISLAITRCE